MASELDDTDRTLLRLLNENARQSDEELAAQLDTDAEEVGERIERLKDDGVITKFTAMIGPEEMGYVSVAFGFSAQPGKTDAIARELSEYENIYKVWVLSGRHNLIAHGSFNDITEFQEFSHEELHDIEGINNYETSIATRSVLNEGSVLLEKAEK